ncbi:uncharacterized protein TNCV_2053381 [Trichonephila clavipes]|nr:uncharacterized protein TNCV_2053381 [Trichonephila clavipes]
MNAAVHEERSFAPVDGTWHKRGYSIAVRFWAPKLDFTKVRAEVDMPLRRSRRQYEKLSQFERGRIIDIMEAGWSARRVARHLGHSDCVVKSIGTSGSERCHLHDDQLQDALDRPVVEKTATS